MDAKDRELNIINPNVVDVVSVEAMADVTIEDLTEVVPGYVVTTQNASDICVSEPVVTDDTDSDSHEEIPPHKNGKLKHVLECMLFVSSEPMNSKQLADMLELDQAKVEEALVSLVDDLNGARGLQLMRLAGGYQLCTKPEFAEYCALILQPAKKKLSKAALETLAVVSYRQPCTMPEVESVRGVSVDGVMKTLMERGLVKEVGRKQVPGRPILYATTPEFLEYFGLNDISELPDIDMLAVEEVRALEAQRELFTNQDSENESESENQDTSENI